MYKQLCKNLKNTSFSLYQYWAVTFPTNINSYARNIKIQKFIKYPKIPLEFGLARNGRLNVQQQRYKIDTK